MKALNLPTGGTERMGVQTPFPSAVNIDRSPRPLDCFPRW